MKVSIILKPRQSWLFEALNDFYIINYSQWRWEVEFNTMVDRVPFDKLESIYKEFQHVDSDYKLILATSIGSISKKQEMKRIESLFIQKK